MNIVLCESATRKAGRFNAGNKARSDFLTIAVARGYRHVRLFENDRKKVIIALQIVCGLLRAISLAGRGDTVLVQYPYNPKAVSRVIMRVLSLAQALKGYRVAVLVHDVDGLRIEEKDASSLAFEAKTLDFADLVICHSEAMAAALKGAGVMCEIGILGPFDYLFGAEPLPRSWADAPALVVAGNLSREKCGYLYELPHSCPLPVNLYGVGFDESALCEAGWQHVSYKGAYPPDELPGMLEGQYGLVWDGSEAATCASACGDYLRYNSPHKFSLYLAAGLPVVVWSGSALSSFVREQGVGVVVGSLFEVQKTLAAIGPDEYTGLLGNVARVRADIVAGERLGRLIP